MAERPPFLRVGTIRKPHGIQGELFVALESDRPEAVFQPGRVLHLGDASGVGEGTLTVVRARPFKGGILLRTEEHARRSEALEALRGAVLWVASDRVAPLEEGEYFYHQLIGLRVVDGGRERGRVVDILAAGGQDLLVVERPGQGELWVPFLRAWVARVDLAAGELELCAPAGLWEL